MFGIFSVFFVIIFVFIVGVFIYTVFKGVSTWNKNNHSPRVTVNAVIVSKRTNVSHTNHANAGDITGAHGYHTTTSTSYYVTFQLDSGDRLELRLSGTEYGQLAEGDKGSLTFQGTRYLSFLREY